MNIGAKDALLRCRFDQGGHGSRKLAEAFDDRLVRVVVSLPFFGVRNGEPINFVRADGRVAETQAASPELGHPTVARARHRGRNPAPARVAGVAQRLVTNCLLYTSPSPRDS